MNNPILSVVIPTYNRERLTISLLKKIIPLKKEWVEFVVIDNNSKSVSNLEDEININKWPVSLIKNKHNVGGNENIIRCFEHANAEWIWTIGDDDEVDVNCFNIIYEKIQIVKDTNVFGIHFNWDPQKKYKADYTKVNSLKELFENMHSLGDINFMSSNIFRHDKIGQYLEWVYHHQYNCNPMSTIIMLGIDRNMQFVFSNEKVIYNGYYNKNKSENDFWDVEIVLKGNSLLGEIPLSEVNKKYLIKFLLSFFTPWLAFKGAVREYIKGNSKRESIWAYREMLKHQFVYSSTFKSIYINLLQAILYVFIKPLSGLYKKASKLVD